MAFDPKKITDAKEMTKLQEGFYLLVDSPTQGTRKFCTDAFIAPPEPPEPPTPTPTYLYKWDFTKSLTDEVNGQETILSGSAQLINGEGVSIYGANGRAKIGNDNSSGWILKNKRTFEIDVRNMEKKFTGNNHGRFIMKDTANGFIYRYNNSDWEIYTNDSWRSNILTNNNPNIFKNTTLKMIINAVNDMKIYADNTLIYDGYSILSSDSAFPLFIGSTTNAFYNIIISGIRIYENEEE